MPIDLPDIDMPEPSRLINIAQGMTPGAEILSYIAIEFQNNSLKIQIGKEINQISENIYSMTKGIKAGFLIKVNLYADEFGSVIIPGGEIITPLGIGTEPIDALAEAYRLSTKTLPSPIAAPVPAKNFSSYLWLFEKDGLQIRTIPKEFREEMERQARKEADRRDLLAAWNHVLPDSRFHLVQRANFWRDVYIRDQNKITNDSRRNEIAKITERMEVLQNHINESSERFSDIISRSAQSLDLIEVLTKVLGIVQIINTAVSVNELNTADGKKVTAGGAAEYPVNNLITLRKIFRKKTAKSVLELEDQLVGTIDELKMLDNQISDKWKAENIPVPNRNREHRDIIPWRYEAQ